jgi:hypothetical protein
VGKIDIKISNIIKSVPLFALTLAYLYLLPDLMIVLVYLSIFPTLDGHSNSFVSTVSPNDFTIRVGKINNKTSQIIRSGSRYK